MKRILLIFMLLAIPLSAFSMPCENDCERHGRHFERMDRCERHHHRNCDCVSFKAPPCIRCMPYYHNYYYNRYTPFDLNIRARGFGLRIGL